MNIDFDEKEADREESSFNSGLYSLIGAGVCQLCGSVYGMHGFRREALATLPPLPGELLYTLPGDHESIFTPCPLCNAGEAIPAGYTKLLVISSEEAKK